MSDSITFSERQRWISTSEPELGLGVIIACENRRVEITFPTHDTTRMYAAESAPLQRIIFSPGNTIRTIDGRKLLVVSVAFEDGCAVYLCGKEAVHEEMLDDTLSFASPEQRLSTGIADGIHAFDLRWELVRYKAELAASPVRGFSGGRIDLIPHQLYIASQATKNARVRVLLADETGLGKTIEACLILQRLLLTGQATRVLIIVPDSLVHQWFVELLRRFNCTFRLLTDDTIPDEEKLTDDYFSDDQLWLCSDAILENTPSIVERLRRTEWDLCIVDEVHHIKPQSRLFSLLNTFSTAVNSLILLSATPEQFGREAHLQRLRLLDPHRYTDTEPLEVESHRLRLVADSIDTFTSETDAIITNETMIPLTEECHSFLSQRIRNDIDNAVTTLPTSLTVNQLVDLFGAGRSYFRNTRATISGFPNRRASIITLDQSDNNDPMAQWVASFIGRCPDRKTLIITSTIEAAVTLQETLRTITSADAGVFHEGMTLLQRDRQAAWFAEVDGPSVLICSETGSEGRNFQFCSNLILLNLPWNPELLEQRIGRLDRIGQQNDITIHVPVVSGTPDELLCRWYHEGADAFEHNVPAAASVFSEMRPRLERCAQSKNNNDSIEIIIEDTRQRIAVLNGELFRHRDYLLEFASNNPLSAQHIITTIEQEVLSRKAERVMKKLFKHYNIKLEDAGEHRLAMITDYCTDHAFPLPRAKRPVLTYHRQIACAHEHIEFITPDHPMLNSALDLFLSSPHGTSAFALWNDLTTTELLLETIYVAECIAPPGLRLHRFFTPTPLRIIMNHHECSVAESYPPELLRKHCKNGPVNKLVTQEKLIQETFPRLVKASVAQAEHEAAERITEAKKQVHESYKLECDRLTTLFAQGAPVLPEEIEQLNNEEKEINALLESTRVRCDSLRLIWRGPVKGEQ